MLCTVLVDNFSDTFSGEPAFGLSLLLGRRVLFDTGPTPQVLQNNCHSINLAIDAINHVVLSHPHWDHCDGFSCVASTQAAVWLCSGFDTISDKTFITESGQLHVTDGPVKIDNQIYSTGPLPGVYNDAPMPEHALVVKGVHGLWLICGCAHFAIDRCIEEINRRIFQAFKLHSVTGIIGGFHLRHAADDYIIKLCDRLKLQGIRAVIPLHCSGENGRRIMQQEFGASAHLHSLCDTFEI